MKKIIINLSILISLVMLSFSCNLTVEPTDAINTSSLAKTSDGILNVTNGCYAMFKDNIEFGGFVDQNNNYLRQYFQMSDFSSDDIVCGQVTEDPLFYSFTLTHSPDQANARFFWYVSYKIINSANTVIEISKGLKDPNAETRQLIGENYFLRAFCHFNLVKFFAKPYSIDPAAPGIILRNSTSEDPVKARSTVQEVYEFVVDDLKTAAALMGSPRGPQYASRAAAWAMLSRMNLYMENNNEAKAYADSVISSGDYSLETPEGFKTYFANAAGSPETIFNIAFTPADNKGKFGSIASMLYSDGNSGWGEEYASQSLRELMAQHPEDVRWSYIDTLFDDEGNIATKNGIEIYYITKFSFQDGDPNLSSPVMFRLAEMYLNRAEANAKMGNDKEALDDVDAIRANRGLENSLYNGTAPSGMTALDVVLDERRIELAFEGQRVFDVYRNKRNLDRSYWGYHLAGLIETDIDLSVKPQGYPNEVVQWTNPRINYYIPVDEILANKLCVQNP